eukprot:333913_1
MSFLHGSHFQDDECSSECTDENVTQDQQNPYNLVNISILNQLEIVKQQLQQAKQRINILEDEKIIIANELNTLKGKLPQTCSCNSRPTRSILSLQSHQASAMEPTKGKTNTLSPIPSIQYQHHDIIDIEDEDDALESDVERAIDEIVNELFVMGTLGPDVFEDAYSHHDQSENKRKRVEAGSVCKLLQRQVSNPRVASSSLGLDRSFNTIEEDRKLDELTLTKTSTVDDDAEETQDRIHALNSNQNDLSQNYECSHMYTDQDQVIEDKP